MWTQSQLLQSLLVQIWDNWPFLWSLALIPNVSRMLQIGRVNYILKSSLHQPSTCWLMTCFIQQVGATISDPLNLWMEATETISKAMRLFFHLHIYVKPPAAGRIPKDFTEVKVESRKCEMFFFFLTVWNSSFVSAREKYWRLCGVKQIQNVNKKVVDLFPLGLIIMSIVSVQLLDVFILVFSVLEQTESVCPDLYCVMLMPCCYQCGQECTLCVHTHLEGL